MHPDTRQTRLAHRAAAGVSWLLLVALAVSGHAGAIDRMWLAGELVHRITAGEPVRAIVERGLTHERRREQRDKPRVCRAGHASSRLVAQAPASAQCPRAVAHTLPLPRAILAIPPPAAC